MINTRIKVYTSIKLANTFLYNSRLKHEVVNWVKTNKIDFFITLTLADNYINKEFARNTLRVFIHRLNRKIYGKRSDKKITIFPFMEQNKSNGWHFHILLQKPLINKNICFKSLIKKTWTKLDGTGNSSFKRNEWFQELVSLRDVERCAHYSLKQIHQNEISLVLEFVHYDH